MERYVILEDATGREVGHFFLHWATNVGAILHMVAPLGKLEQAGGIECISLCPGVDECKTVCRIEYRD